VSVEKRNFKERKSLCVAILLLKSGKIVVAVACFSFIAVTFLGSRHYVQAAKRQAVWLLKFAIN